MSESGTPDELSRILNDASVNLDPIPSNPAIVVPVTAEVPAPNLTGQINEFDRKVVEYNKGIDGQITNLKAQKEHLAEQRRSETRANEREMLLAQEQLNRTELHRLEAEKETNAQFSSDLERWNHLLENKAEVFEGRNELQERIAGARENVNALKTNLGKNYHEMMGRDIEEGVKGVEQELIHYEYDNLPRQLWSEETKTWAEKQSQINHPSLSKDEFGRGNLTLSRRENPAEKEFNEKALPALMEHIKEKPSSEPAPEPPEQPDDENSKVTNENMTADEIKALIIPGLLDPNKLTPKQYETLGRAVPVENGSEPEPEPESESEVPQNDLRTRLRSMSDYLLGGGLGVAAALGGGVITTEILTQIDPVIAFNAGEYLATSVIFAANALAERAREFGNNHPHLLRIIRGASGGALATSLATTAAATLKAAGVINIMPGWPHGTEHVATGITATIKPVVEATKPAIETTKQALDITVKEGQNLSTIIKDFLHLNAPQQIYRHTVETILGNLDKLPADKAKIISGLTIDQVMHDSKLFRLVMDAGRIIQPGQVFNVK